MIIMVLCGSLFPIGQRQIFVPIPTPQINTSERAWDEIRKWNYIDVEGQGIHLGTRGLIKDRKIYQCPPSWAPQLRGGR